MALNSFYNFSNPRAHIPSILPTKNVLKSILLFSPRLEPRFLRSNYQLHLIHTKKLPADPALPGANRPPWTFIPYLSFLIANLSPKSEKIGSQDAKIFHFLTPRTLHVMAQNVFCKSRLLTDSKIKLSCPWRINRDCSRQSRW